MGSLPSPPVALDGHCSTVYNSTLFTYQWNAFQSLPLQEGAQWSQLPMGVAVNGSRCVLGKWNSQDAMIIVGGTTINPADSQYPGLQHWDFATKSWATPPSGASVTQNRQMHGAAYLNLTNSILVYSGFQDDSFVNSSETFTISTQEPYTMKSFPAQSPPGMNPIVLPWNSSHGMMVGGSADNTNVWVFSEATGWQQIQISLPDGVGNMSMVQGSLIQGESDAKALQLFNMSSNPNQVTSLLVQSGDDQPASKRVEHGTVVIEDGKRLSSRQVNFDSWPAYNGTEAPTVIRNGFSLSQSSSGVVIISGGTTSSDSVCMFNQTGNSWIDAHQFFSGKSEGSASTAAGTATSTSTLSTATSSASASTSPVSSSGGLTDNGRVVLGSVLGGLAGLAAILIMLLFLLRYRKARRQKWQRKALMEKRSQLGFDGTVPVAGYGQRKGSGSSKSSSDRGFFSRNQSPENLTRPQISNPQLLSDSTGTDKDLTHARTMQPGPVIGASRGEARDTGWSQYFDNSNSSTALNNSNERDAVLGSGPSRQMAYSISNYNRKSSAVSIHPVEPELEPVTTRSSGYPQSEESWEKSKFHPPSTYSANYRPGTAISHVSEEAPESFLDPASSSSGTQGWDPVGTGDGQSNYNRRPSSSMYADSINFPHPGDKVFIPGVTDVNDSSARVNNSWRQPYNNRGLRTMATKDFGMASKPPSSALRPNTAATSTTGSVSLTQDDRAPIQSDMSWLNLGH